MLMRKLSIALALGSFVALNGFAVAADPKAKPAETKAEVKPAEKPADAAKPAKSAESAGASSVKLTKPWSDLTLTDEQKVKIDAIHKKALAETNVIEKKEKEDITALLTDAQKAELKDLTSKKRKEATAKKVETPEKKAPETTEKK